ENIEQVLRLPIERCQIPFLVSKAGLKRCSIWGEMSASKGDEALAEYKKALEVMCARKSAPKRAAFVEADEVQFLRSSKRLTVAAAAPSSSKKKSKASGSSPSASYDWATVLTNLNTKNQKIKKSHGALPKAIHPGVIEWPQRNLLWLPRKPRWMLWPPSCVRKRDKEIKALRLKVRNQEEAGELAATENVSLRGQLKNREEELNDLKDTAETFEAEKAMAVNGVCRWEYPSDHGPMGVDADSPVSRSDRSPYPGTGSEHDLASPLPYVYASPSPIGPAYSVSEDDMVEWRRKGYTWLYFFLDLLTLLSGTHPVLPEGEDTVVRARQLPLGHRQVPFLLSNSALHRSSLWGNMSGNTSNDPFAAYQEAAKVMSAKKGSASRTVSGDDLMITGSRRTATVKIEPSALVQTKKSRGGDGTILPSGEPLEFVQVLQGGLLRTISQLFHFGERLSIESSLVSQEELDDLKHQVSEEKAQRVAREMEIRDLKDKLKDAERAAEMSSADAYWQEEPRAGRGHRNSESRYGDGRKWGKSHRSKKSNQWDLAKALEQYKTIALEEAQNKGAPVPLFEDEPAIPHREWLKAQTDSWDPSNVLEQYKTVKITEAELLGLPTPSFEGEPQVPGDVEREKVPEPAANDPPAS
ncbi:LOW QUALITY PROTEIN: hypothetical protein HID58_070867, partial [Brassica napus]